PDAFTVKKKPRRHESPRGPWEVRGPRLTGRSRRPVKTASPGTGTTVPPPWRLVHVRLPRFMYSSCTIGRVARGKPVRLLGLPRFWLRHSVALRVAGRAR